MLRFLNQYSRSRGAWLLVVLTTLILEVITLWFQYGMKLEPCILCIYERCALFGVMISGLVGIIAPKTVLRYVAFAICLYSSWKGIEFTWRHIIIQLYPSPFMTCNFAASFPSWLPLDRWLPQVFITNGDCSVRQWQFLKFEIPQWLAAVFVLYFIISLLALFAQLYKLKKCDPFS